MASKSATTVVLDRVTATLSPATMLLGPSVAAASYLCEAYYEIRATHERYGLIVRINPDELHCADPRFTDEIYSATPGRVCDKWLHQLGGARTGPAAATGFAALSHELHRERRAPLSRFFSRQQMLKLEGEVLDFAHRTVDKMLRNANTRRVFDVKDAFNCFTADVISQHAFSADMGFVGQAGWGPCFATWVRTRLHETTIADLTYDHDLIVL
ncbi:cytochrome P450 [Lasiosphaeria ovina]|uniref:Cytochrome P450 n=1 Tax=Lasiosphaeria ovina TaxID=92902 RepID=A0AAE0K068_9PEZI|nr:cytochrome P450 [Lasiosphaeria ovina]